MAPLSYQNKKYRVSWRRHPIFSALLALCIREFTDHRSPHKGQCRGTWICYLICAWTNSWANNGDTGDLRRHCARYDVTVMWEIISEMTLPLPPIMSLSTENGVCRNQDIDGHKIDVIMTTMAYQITSLTVLYSAVYSDADQRKRQSSPSLAFVWGIHRDRWIPRTKGQLRGKCFHLMTSSCYVKNQIDLKMWVTCLAPIYSTVLLMCMIKFDKWTPGASTFHSNKLPINLRADIYASEE